MAFPNLSDGKPPRCQLFIRVLARRAELTPKRANRGAQQRLIETALSRRKGVRFVVSLVTGLRQGEVLGLEWTNVNLEAGVLRVRKQRIWPRYKHGCPSAEPCGHKHSGYCPQRVNTQPITSVVKSDAGRRPFALPPQLVELLKAHKVAQAQERELAGSLWRGEDWVFASETGEILHPRTEWDRWKELLCDAKIRDARLHDARHTAATNLLVIGVLDRVTQGLMGWSNVAMTKRYQHLTAPVQRMSPSDSETCSGSHRRSQTRRPDRDLFRLLAL